MIRLAQPLTGYVLVCVDEHKGQMIGIWYNAETQDIQAEVYRPRQASKGHEGKLTQEGL